jgi:hypothetical protein
MPDIGALIQENLAPFGRAADKLTDQLLAREQHRERLRGRKPGMRMPIVRGQAVGSALTMGVVGQNPLQGPDLGFVWSVRAVILEGLTSGGAPDVVNILRSDGRLFWQLNGNQPGQTWGKGERILYPGEFLTYQSVGTFNSTAVILAHGEADQVPAQLIGEIF